MKRLPMLLVALVAACASRDVASPSSNVGVTPTPPAAAPQPAVPYAVPLDGSWTYYKQDPKFRETTGSPSFTFPVGPSTVNYLFRKNTRLTLTPSNRFVVEFTVTASPETTFHWDDTQPASCTMPAMAAVMFWSNNGGEGVQDRWWAYTQVRPLAVGAFTVDQPLTSSQWFSVYGQHGDEVPADFTRAIQNVWAVAITFGGGCYYGHGVYVRPGAASFALTRYAIE